MASRELIQEALFCKKLIKMGAFPISHKNGKVNGYPDIEIFYAGNHFYTEYKLKGGKISANQHNMKKRFKEYGNQHVAFTFDILGEKEFMKDIKENGKPTKDYYGEK